MVGQSSHLVAVEAVQEKHELGLGVATVPGRKLAYLMQQVRIVLITQRRNESLVVAACILAVTRGTPLHIRRLAERYPLAAAGLRRYGGLQPIEVCGDVGPFLRIVHLALHE